ncbi:MAG TPA: response regulator [Micromonosporaceae bacterium]|nr:response regulator [Micromonosporaceae bacterium]
MLALVIDESSLMRMILKRTVTPLGFDVIEVRGAAEAVELLARLQRAPDLALVAWNSPQMDVAEFIETVRADPKLAFMTLVMVTSESDQRQALHALAGAAHGHVIRSFTANARDENLVLLGLVPTVTWPVRLAV